MIDGSEKCNHQLAFELQNLHVCEKRSKKTETKNLLVMYSADLPIRFLSLHIGTY